MVAAQSSGKRVEDLSQGDPYTRVFAEPDGSWSTESAPEPVRAPDEEGEWAPIDLTLVKVGGRLVPRNALGDVSLSAGGDKVFANATPEDGSGKLAWRWPTELPEPTVDGATATYEDVVEGGGDLVVTATTTGFSHNVVLDEAPQVDAQGEADPVSYSIPVITPGAEIQTTADGGIEVVSDEAGHDVVASAPAPIMWDSSESDVAAGDPGDPAVAPVDATVVDTAAGGRMVLTPDMDFLTDPDTVYPVTIDPTFSLYSNADTWIMNAGYTTSQSSSIELRAGTYDDGTHLARSFLKFPADSYWAGREVRSANISLRNFSSTSCSAGAIRASRITESWSSTSITWANQPTITSANAGQYSPAYGFEGCPQADAVFSITDIAKAWSTGTPNYGIRLSAVTETNPNTWRRYRSIDYTAEAYHPKLNVNYNSFPSTPTSLQVTPSPGGAYISSTTPTLSAVVTDPDASQVAGYFEVKQGSVVKWSGTSPMVPSGGTAAVTVPSGKLTDGGQYTVTVRGQDGLAAQSAAAVSKTVTVDTAVPDVIITSNVFTDGTWTTTLPNSATTTLNGSADTAAFLLDYDNGAIKSSFNANSSGDATMTYAPTPGWHVLTITPIDAAGNYGTPVTFSHGVGAAAFTAPYQWTPSTASFPIDLSSRPSATGATLQWRLAGQTTWTTATKVKKADGADWTGTVSSSTGRSTTGPLVWKASEEDNGTGTLAPPALLQVRGCFQYSGSTPASCTAALYLGLHLSAFDERFPTATLGPVEVALNSGEALFGGNDVVDANAGITRTFSSLQDSTLSAGLFGPGWTDPDVLAPAGDASAELLDNRSLDGTLLLVDLDGSVQRFSPVAGTSGEEFRPTEPTGDDTRMLYNPGSGTAPDTVVLHRPLGSQDVVVTWEWQESDTGGESGWILAEADSPGDEADIDVDTVGQRPVFVRQSDVGAASTCNFDRQSEGCRGLKITYIGTGPSMRVSKIERVIGKAAQPDVVPKVLATYTYESGQLTKVCGPAPEATRDPLCTQYTYTTAAGRTMVASLKPPGLAPWRFAYDSIGRLQNVKRERPSASGGGDAVWSIDYGLAVDAVGLPDMGAVKVAEWGQQTVPTKVYAVYSPTDGAPSLDKAQLLYTDQAGRTTNTARRGPNGWLVETSWYDTIGNETQQLDATGWARVQAAPASERPRTAIEASSFSIYNDWGGPLKQGTRKVHEYGPAHTATLADGTTGTYREHAHYIYDDDPEVAPELVASRPSGSSEGLGLVVEQVTSVSTADRARDFDSKIDRFGYAETVTGDGNGWSLGKPTTVSNRLASGQWSTTTTRYDETGAVVELRQPGGATDGTGVGTDAHSTVTSYYSAAGGGDCGDKPSWAGLVCKTGPAAQPSGEPVPVTHYVSYNDDLVPTVVVERSGSATKTSTTTFDQVGRRRTVTVSTAGSGIAQDTVSTEYTYSNVTGALVSVEASGQVVTTDYDEWGRVIATGSGGGASPATVAYDPTGRVAQKSNGAVSSTYAYGDADQLESVAFDSGIGTFQYRYKADGSMNEVDFPNGITASYPTDETSTPIGTEYRLGSTSLLSFTTSKSASGHVQQQSSAGSAQRYEYDQLGRLAVVEDYRSGACTTRAYGFSMPSVRTSRRVYGSATDGTCQRNVVSSEMTSTYDSATRITNPGYAYDAMGRTLSVPAAETATGGLGPLSVTYHANDMVKSLTQQVQGSGGAEVRNSTYALEPLGRVAIVTDRTDGVETGRLQYRYGDAGDDSPASVQSSIDGGATWATTKYAAMAEFGLVAQVTGGIVTYHLANPHGDLVASADAAGVLGTYDETDEFGNAATDSTSRYYGWLGAHQRSSGAVGGLVLMGVRLYNPRTGTFLSTDPVPGGNSTTYGYPQDPVNTDDVSGACLRPYIWCSEYNDGGMPPKQKGYVWVKQPLSNWKIGRRGEIKVWWYILNYPGTSDVYRGQKWPNRQWVRFKSGVYKLRVYDISFRYRGKFYLLEVKANSSHYTLPQRLKDARMIELGWNIAFIRVKVQTFDWVKVRQVDWDLVA